MRRGDEGKLNEGMISLSSENTVDCLLGTCEAIEAKISDANTSTSRTSADHPRLRRKVRNSGKISFTSVKFSIIEVNEIARSPAFQQQQQQRQLVRK